MTSHPSFYEMLHSAIVIQNPPKRDQSPIEITTRSKRYNYTGLRSQISEGPGSRSLIKNYKI